VWERPDKFGLLPGTGQTAATGEAEATEQLQVVGQLAASQLQAAGQEQDVAIGQIDVTGTLQVTGDPHVVGQLRAPNRFRLAGEIQTVPAMERHQDFCIASVYRNGRKNPTALNRGPFVNLCWMLYFLGIWLLGKHPLATSATDAHPAAACTASTTWQVLSSCFFILAGILILRCDGNARARNYRKWTWIRSIVIVGLLLIYFVLGRYVWA
jgi:hypothetical protein